MKKIILLIAFLMLWASSAIAQQAAGSRTADAKSGESEDVVEGRIGAGWYGISHEGNVIGAGEYDYLKSSASGALNLEWDPLPHRFVLESYFLNPKDYFGELDYAFKDIVLLNGFTRDVFHNLNHYSFGTDDLVSTPSITDLNPADEYGIENRIRRGSIRLKTPDFPLHLYAEVRTIERDGLIQQRFYRVFDDTKVSQSRRIDWNTTEYRAGLNSHLGPIEADYSHAEKKFEARGDKLLFDASATGPVPRNLVPDLKSSSDTVKIHTSYSGRFVLAGTYSTGDKKNEDSGAKVQFTNGAGDIMLMPVTSMIFTMKYRHFDLESTNPNTVTATGIGTFNVRDSLSSNRDILSALLRYRVTDRLTVKGEYITDTTDRTRGTWGSVLAAPPSNAPAFWTVPESTTKNTGKLGFAYRIMNKMNLRADYSATNVDNPAYAIDPDKAQTARAAFTWNPTLYFNTMLSYGMVREKRDNLGGLLGGGSREASRDQAQASTTFLIGSRSSLTASYAYYKNKVEQTITLTDGLVVPFELEPRVPYEDTSHVGSLALTVAPSEVVNLTASATRSFSQGSYRLSGAGVVTNVAGIAELSDLDIVDTVYTAGIEMQHTRYLSSEVRLQYQHYDDQIDDAQDGTVKLALATVFLKW